MGKNKVDRNGPCPCGSGRKYKKCCLRLGKGDPYAQGAPKKPPEPSPEWQALERAGLAMLEEVAMGGEIDGVDYHPWAVEMLRDQLGVRPDTAPGIAAWRTMATDELLRALKTQGIDIDRQGFVTLAEGRVSAWKLADEHWGGAHLVACELWRRLLPERPSVEMLAERMQQGYEDERRALDIWFSLFDDLLRVLPDVRSLEQADALFPGLKSLDDWLGDFEMALHNATIDDKRVGRRGLALYDRILSRWTDTKAKQVYLRVVADLHDLIGEHEQSEAIFRALIDEDPECADFYCELAWNLRRRDQPRAVALLEEALARPVRDTHSVMRMLVDLRDTSQR